MEKMDFHSVMETFAEAWVAANTHTPLTEAAEQVLTESGSPMVDKEVLIEKVLAMPPIWDKRLKLYSNRHVVDQCWKEIAEDMGFEEHELRKKWRYLRDQFCIELGKSTQPRTAALDGESSTSKWPYFETLMFLKDIVRPRLPLRYLKKMAPQDNMTENGSIYTDTDKAQENEDDLEDLSSSINQKGPVSPFQSQQIISQKRLQDHDNAKNNGKISEIKTKKTKLLEDASKTQKPDCDDFVFFQSLLPYVEKIPPNLKLKFRNQIQQVVDEFAFPSSNQNSTSK